MITQANAIRLFLLGLPLGLIILGVGSMFFHLQKTEESRVRLTAQGFAHSITEEELRGSLGKLVDLIGERHLKLPERLATAANFIASTLGPQNAGYEVARQAFEVEGVKCENLWVERKGGKLLNETVIVAAHYDSAIGGVGANAGGTGVAALFALAKQFSNVMPQRTLRFVFLVNGVEQAGTEASGAFRYAQFRRGEGDAVKAVLCLDGLGRFEDEPTLTAPLSDYLPENGPYLALIGSPDTSNLVAEVARGFVEPDGFSIHRSVLQPEQESSGLRQSDAWGFRQSSFPCVLVRSSGSFQPTGSPDGIGLIDFDRFTGVVRGLAETLHSLVNPIRS